MNEQILARINSLELDGFNSFNNAAVRLKAVAPDVPGILSNVRDAVEQVNGTLDQPSSDIVNDLLDRIEAVIHQVEEHNINLITLIQTCAHQSSELQLKPHIDTTPTDDTDAGDSGDIIFED